MNINGGFFRVFSRGGAAARGGSPRAATERDARGKEGLCEAERSESHANGEREGDARVRARETGTGRREGVREREKGTPGAHRIKESASE